MRFIKDLIGGYYNEQIGNVFMALLILPFIILLWSLVLWFLLKVVS